MRFVHFICDVLRVVRIDVMDLLGAGGALPGRAMEEAELRQLDPSVNIPFGKGRLEVCGQL